MMARHGEGSVTAIVGPYRGGKTARLAALAAHAAAAGLRWLALRPPAGPGDGTDCDAAAEPGSVFRPVVVDRWVVPGPHVSLVLIDDVHALGPPRVAADIAEIVVALRMRRIDLAAAGIMHDCEGRVWEPVAALLRAAYAVVPCRGVCCVCGGPSDWTGVAPSGGAEWESYCGDHHPLFGRLVWPLSGGPAISCRAGFV